MAAIEAMKMVSRNVILRIFIGIMVLMGVNWFVVLKCK